MANDKIRTYYLEKHNTKDVINGHINGTLIPVWRDWDNTITKHPKMVYVTSVNPGEIKGPHMHLKKHYYFLCIQGSVVFIIKDKDGKYREIGSQSENPLLIEVPKNFPSAHINLSHEVSMILCLTNIAWKPDENEMIDVAFDDYDWTKWNVKR